MCGFLLRPNAQRVVAENIRAFPLVIVSSYCEQLSDIALFVCCTSNDQNTLLFFQGSSKLGGGRISTRSA